MAAQMQQITSKAFSHIGYDEQAQELHVTFRGNGQTWRYPLDQDEFQEFLSAPSKGTWFHENVDKTKGQRA